MFLSCERTAVFVGAIALLLATAAVSAEHNPYGTTSHLTRTGYGAREALCAKFGSVGAKWMRMDFDWRVLERTPGVFTFDRYDNILAAAESNGVQVVAILGSPPPRCRPVWEHLEEWKGFVRAVASHYRGRIPVYEVWNEPCAKEFWGAEPSAADYLTLLRAAYETLKDVDPSIRVALGSLTRRKGLAFCESLYRLGAAKWFDIMNVHPYYESQTRPCPEADLDVWLDNLKGIMAHAGDADKEIWITEIGYPAPWIPKFAAPGLLRAGLRAIAPDRKAWRTLVIDPAFEMPFGGEALLDLVRRELPSSSEVLGCGYAAFARTLAGTAPDLVVISPRSQTYPIRDGEALAAFAKAGGVIAEFGGMPFCDGLDGETGTLSPTQLRRALRLDVACWWMKDRPSVPRQIQVRPTSAAADLACPSDGWTGARFVTADALGPGDTFTPLLKATWTNGVDCVAAAAIRYENGGGLVVSGLFEGVVDIFSEREQSIYLPRTHLVAFASGVSTVMWYELRSHDYDRQDGGWGLLHVDLGARPAWTAYRTLIAMRPSGSQTLSAKPCDDGVWHVAWRRPDGRRAGALWTTGAAREHTIDLGMDALRFQDYLGRRIEPNKARNGVWRLNVSAEVVYYVEKEPETVEPLRDCRPETWFHLIGGNVSKEGLTADLEAIRAAGLVGIHLFHGQMGESQTWPGVTNPIPCLSAGWDGMAAHAAAECRRLGLSFKMQNCPGWSMSGGPWIRPENAMRNLCFSRTDVRRGSPVHLPLPAEASDHPARDYRDLFVLAFPMPKGDADGWLKPSDIASPSPQVRLFSFANPVTVRTLEIPSTSGLNHNRTYDPETTVVFEAETEPGVWRTVVRETLPPGNWQDNRKCGVRQTLSCDEATARRWRLTLQSKDPVRLGDVRLSSAARMEHWEGLAGWTVRGLVDRGVPKQNPACWIDANTVLDLTDRLGSDGTLDWMPPAEDAWTVLRIGHVNGLYRNGPAPQEATGWECSKLSPRGIEANYAAYIGRLAKGPLKGLIDGVVVDSWECYRDNWTDGLEDIFRKRRGYDLVRHLPSVFGWVVDSPPETERFLRDWRGLLGDLIEENYYGRLAELAHADGLSVQYETAFGDALAGDLLAYWKHADVPMCEFWRPTMPTGVGSADFKSVLPCVSAAHVYGKRRVAAEALTNCKLDWNEALCDFKPVLDRHFAKGVTFPVFHTYTHNPQVGFKKPGTSFGYFIGTPFLRGQTWWDFMPLFTDYCARCTEFLESGMPVVDILRVLGDGLGHKPSEREPHFGNRFKDDYVNRDVLLNRLSVKDGRLVLPDGMSYSVLWIPEGTFLDATSRAKIDELARAGARVVEGSDPTAGLVPDIEAHGNALVWYHRRTDTEDLYFVAAPDVPVVGTVRFRGRPVMLSLEAGESRFVRFAQDGAVSVTDPVTGLPPVEVPAGEAVELGGFKPGAMRAAFDFTAQRNERVVIDLGLVEQCAEVSLNGASVGRLWCAPYRIDLTGLVAEGTNRLEVSVTATWHNRLVHEASLPEAARTTWTLYGPKADAPLKPAGLYGKVLLWRAVKE